MWTSTAYQNLLLAGIQWVLRNVNADVAQLMPHAVVPNDGIADPPSRILSKTMKRVLVVP